MLCVYATRPVCAGASMCVRLCVCLCRECCYEPRILSFCCFTSALLVFYCFTTGISAASADEWCYEPRILSFCCRWRHRYFFLL